MEVNIGIRNVTREVSVDVENSAGEVEAAVATAIENGTPLRLTDSHGRVVVVPADVIGYVEIAANESRRVGFGFTG
ncbi:MAG: DUF3107 domain-containing protein [Actinomycetaceae bacterium]|nr:DUF3107 domain-containing protein [Actinomycetaceae bacterium]